MMELLNPSTFKSYRHAAAGHKGTMSDESDEFFIKPSTQREIDFYNEVKAQESPLEEVIPEFFGNLGLLGSGNEALVASVLRDTGASDPAQLSSIVDQKSASTVDPNAASSPVQVDPEVYARLNGIANGQNNSDVHGRAINSSQYLVLENLTGGFDHPNVMDIKLGSRLWDDDAAMDKRDRLDNVAKTTTSIEKNFRVAGIRLYVGEEYTKSFITDPFPWRTKTGLTGLRCIDSNLQNAIAEAATNYGHLYNESISKPVNGSGATDEPNLLSFTSAPENVLVHTKHYGRAMLSWDIFFVLERFICVKGAKLNWTHAAITLTYFIDQCKTIKAALETSETRMYSPSILLVYEGDGEAYERKLKANESLARASRANEADNSDESNDEPVPEKIFELKLIDFAHAHFTPGQGPDTNIIAGVDNLIKHLETVLDHAERRAEGIDVPTES